MARDRVQEIRERLAIIASQDTKLVVETNRAIRRMAELGLDFADVKKFLAPSPVDEYPEVEIDGIPSGGAPKVVDGTKDPGFHGFENRRQASLAAWASMSKKDWPAALQAGHERTNTLMKNVAVEQVESNEEQSIIMMPMMVVQGQVPEGGTKTFRRLKNGKLKELSSPEEDVIDVEIDEAPEAAILAALGDEIK